MPDIDQHEGSNQLPLFSDTPPLAEVLEGDGYAKLRDDAEKLQKRLVDTDTEGVVTSARSLLETCCKHILETLSIPFSDGDRLTSLHKKVAHALNLHPSQHAEEQLRGMMSGCANIVSCLAPLRNSHSDAHGKKPGHVPLDHGQAEFVAYMAYGLVRFLVQAFEQQVNRKTRKDLSDDEKEMLLSIWREVANENGVTDPDQVIFKPAFEEIALRFTKSSGLVLSREDIYKFLSNARKSKKLWPTPLDTNGSPASEEES